MTKAGAEITLHEIMLRLKEKGHHVIVFCNNPSVDEYEGITIKPANNINKFGKQIDVIFTQLDFTKNALTIARELNKPIVHLAHGDASLKLYRLNYRNVQMIISNSNWVNDSFKTLVNVPKLVVYPPLTIDKYKVNNKDAKAITMVNLIDLKGGNLFWQLARVMPDREFIAVKGGYGNQIMYPKDLPNVTIMENQDDMREVFKKSRIILMPSSYESWGRVGMEAAVSGIPTIATATEGLLESLGNSGVFLENRDVASLVEAIRLLDDEETYKKHSEFAKNRALEVSSKFNSQIDDVEKAMLKIVNKKVS
jgi:glycosyltransferase involved in cell wall biosynthesis